MKQYINLDTWNRKDHFHFFRRFEEPFFGVTVTIDCTHAYATAKAQNISFFLYYLYQSLAAANEITPFRYRIENKTAVACYDVVHASPTINRTDGTFGFSYLDYDTNSDSFYRKAANTIREVQASTGLVPAINGENVIHYSSIPWIDFTSLSHARSFSFADSCPKISFGKMTVNQDKRTMPVSVHVHHALMDGYHVAQFIDLFQTKMQA
jgi:chloramphenicol O-acetyltransferase type A